MIHDLEDFLERSSNQLQQCEPKESELMHPDYNLFIFHPITHHCLTYGYLRRHFHLWV